MAASASFEEFYAATVGRLLGHLFLVTGDLHAAEEIVQEAFTRASLRWAHLRDYDVPEAWVRRVAMNLAIVLHYLVDLPVAEIAQVLGVPHGTVKSLLARGRRALAAKLGESEVIDRA